MSRRKQDKPQPRKRLLNADSEVLQDTLTCGSCQKDFVLSDIVKFIQHKVHLCNKENYHLHNDVADNHKDPDDSGDDDVKPSIQVPNRRPSISAPMHTTSRSGSRLLHGLHHHPMLHGGSLLAARLESKDPTVAVPRTPSPALNHKPHRHKGLTNVQPLFGSPGSPKLVDADTNTTLTEPPSQVCSTCRQSFSSSWLLLQHAQSLHGLRIYLEPERPASARSNPSAEPACSAASNSFADSRPSGERVRLPSPCMALVPVSTAPTPSELLLRVPLGERQFGPTPPTLNGPTSLFPRPPSHEFRLDGLEPPPFAPRLNQAPPSSPSPNPSSAFEHPFDRPRVPTLPFEPQLDFYSQRLRQLAGATSPSAGRKLTASPFASSEQTSPSKKSDPPTVASPKEPSSSSCQPQPPSSSPTSSAGSKSATETTPTGGGRPGSPQFKSCEFCGKTFRFMSNLIVHRRSHTGEKPYKCHICQHACTQSSKLKRHMKTHRPSSSKLSPGSLDNTCSLESGRSTPDSLCVVVDSKEPNGNDSDSHTAGDYDEDEEDDEEVEELDDDLDEDLEEDEDLGREEDLDDELAIAEDLSTPRGAASSPAGTVLNDEEGGRRTPPSSHGMLVAARKSLLGEVMDKIGLSDIQQYNEAYKQALQESFAKGIKQEQRSMLEGALISNGPDCNGKMIGQPALDFGQGLLRAFDRHSPFDAKRLKLDGLGEGGARDLYAGMWLPSVPHRDMFLDAGGDRHKSSSSSESALISVTPGCRLGALSPRPGTSGGGLLSCSPASNGSANNKGLKGDRRSDTCEYCGKVFKNCSNLTVHRRSHTGEKPYKCELCSYACAQSSKLTRHMKTHGRIGKDVYRCRFCDMPFSVPSTLEKHMRKCVVSKNCGGGANLALLDKDSDSLQGDEMRPS